MGFVMRGAMLLLTVTCTNAHCLSVDGSCGFLLRATRHISHRVGWSVDWSVGCSVGLSFPLCFFAFLSYLKVEKCRLGYFKNVRQQFWSPLPLPNSLLPLANHSLQRLPFIRPCSLLIWKQWDSFTRKWIGNVRTAKNIRLRLSVNSFEGMHGAMTALNCHDILNWRW